MKPDDIPQDVWDAAGDVTVGLGFELDGPIQTAIGSAILAERETSARRGGDAIIGKHPILAQQVRNAIRKGSD